MRALCHGQVLKQFLSITLSFSLFLDTRCWAQSELGRSSSTSTTTAKTLSPRWDVNSFPPISSESCRGTTKAQLKEMLSMPIDPATENAMYGCLTVAKSMDAQGDLEFAARIDHLDRYFKIRRSLSQCSGADSEIARSIAERAAMVPPGFPHKDAPWRDGLFGSRSVGGGDVPVLNIIQDRILVQASVNALDHYNLFNRKYGLQSDGVVGKLCRGGCSKEAREAMQERQSAWDQVPLNKQGPDVTKIAQDLNRDIKPAQEAAEKFNSSLHSYTDYDYGAHSGHRAGLDSNESYNKYRQTYWQTFGTDHGLLLATPSLNSKLDVPATDKQINQSDEARLLKTNGQVRADEIKKAAVEGTKLIEDQMKLLNDMSQAKAFVRPDTCQVSCHRKPTDRTRNDYLKDLVRLARTNPLAVAQVLMEDPTLATSFCAVLSSARTMKEADEASEKKWGKVFLFGGLILGITGLALSLTGLGTPLGMALIGVAGSSLGLTAGGYEVSRAYQAHQNYRWHQTSAFASGDRAQLRQAQAEYDSFQKHAFQASVAIGASLAGFLASGMALAKAKTALDQAKSLAAKGVNVKALGDASAEDAARLINASGGDAKALGDVGRAASRDPSRFRQTLDAVNRVCGFR